MKDMHDMYLLDNRTDKLRMQDDSLVTIKHILLFCLNILFSPIWRLAYFFHNEYFEDCCVLSSKLKIIMFEIHKNDY